MTPLYLRIFIIFFASFSVKCLALKKDGSIIIDRIQEQISSRRNWNEDGTDYPSPRESSRCNLNISPGNGYLCDPDQMIGPEDRTALQSKIESTLGKSSCGCWNSRSCRSRTDRYLPMIALADGILNNGSVDNFGNNLMKRKFNTYTSQICRNRDNIADNVILIIVTKQPRKFSIRRGRKAATRLDRKCFQKINEAINSDLAKGEYYKALESALKYTDSVARCDQCNEKCKITVGVIIGIVFGVIGFLIIVIGGVVCCIGFFQNWDCVVGTCIGVCIGMILGCIQACINAIIASIIASMCEACGCEDCCACEPFECVDDEGQPTGFSSDY